MRKSPCETCGACCAFFRVSFPDNAANGINGFGVPEDYSVVLNCLQRSMKGTQAMNPRCIALEGQVGVRVSCRIYAHRPSTCRDFKLSWENNIGNLLCDRARGFFGLQPFSQY